MTARLAVRVTPRARRDSIEGWREGVLLIRVKAPPVDGGANEAVVSLVAEALAVRRRDITVGSGSASRRKVLLVEGLSGE
ncbi:MAG: hypothetical protein GEU28_00555 [Dehalococcoidia bacterium]|nr:hypothetical protein [Dehalococcoidia bacterium]